jgi:replicative DNA helicase
MGSVRSAGMSDLHLFDHRAEKEVIAAALMGSVASLEAFHFHDQRHQLVWQEILRMQSEREPINIETICRALDGRDYGGPAYLTGAVSSPMANINVEVNSKRVRDLKSKRDLLAGMQKAAKQLGDDEPLELIVGGLYDGMATIHIGSTEAEKLSASKVIDSFLDRVADPKDVWGIKTGWGALDYRLGGIHKGELMIIAGEPAVGKSMFAAQLGFQMAGIPFLPLQQTDRAAGAMYQMEMSTEAVIRRACCALSKVPYNLVMTGKASEDEQQKFLQAAEKIHAAPVYISDATDWTTTTLRADVMRLIREVDIEWILIDYAGLLKDEAETEVAREVRISKALHDIAKLGVAVIVVETLNKEGLKRKSGKIQASVRGSVQKVYDADVILFMEKPKDAAEDTDQRQLRLGKAREADSYLNMQLKIKGAEKRIENAT